MDNQKDTDNCKCHDSWEITQDMWLTLTLSIEIDFWEVHLP